MKTLKNGWFWWSILLTMIIVFFLINRFDYNGGKYGNINGGNQSNSLNSINTSVNLSRNVGCSAEYSRIDNKLKNSNYCTVDSDCVYIHGPIDFGCYHYLNKGVDSKELLAEMKTYSSECSDMIDDCGRTPDARCVNGKCVEKG